MHTGMLWFDNDVSKSLTEKIQGALNYYVKKYSKTPDLVLVHPSMLSKSVGASLVLDNIIEVGDKTLTVRPYRPVLPGHLWLGIEDEG